MQLLCRISTGGYDGWRRAFDATAEGRRDAGLNLLQIWRDADAPETALLLFEVRSEARARAHLDEQAQLGHGLGDATFLRLA